MKSIYNQLKEKITPDSKNTGNRGLPTTFRPFEDDARVAGRPKVFEPALAHFTEGFRVGEPAFASPEVARDWRAARRQAMDHVVQTIAASKWRDGLVLRGSLLLKAWLGILAREPGDLDFVVIPQSPKSEDADSLAMLRDLTQTVLQRPPAGDVQFSAEDVAFDDIWLYDRAPGYRIVFPWWSGDLPGGTVQVDFVFNEPMHDPPEKLNVRIPGDERLEWIWTASKRLSLAWKIQWLCTDQHVQGKDLYDATLLAEQVTVPLALLDTVVNPKPPPPHTRPVEFYAGMFEELHVDWDNFKLEYPQVKGTANEWKQRLAQALAPTFSGARAD